MPIQTIWANEDKTIILTTFGEMWTLEEYLDSIDTVYALILSVDHTVHSISDFSRSFASPTHLLSARLHIRKRKAANAGISVVVGAKGIIMALLQVAQRLYLNDVKILLANSTEEAYTILQDHQAKANLPL